MGLKFGLLVLAVLACEVLSSPRCFCPVEHKSVCGTDGTTYLSECLLDCAKKTQPDLAVASKGNCPQAQPPCTCSADDKPVCGTDGVTYSNDCLLNCATALDSTLGIANFGTCEQSTNQGSQATCTCTRNFRPVCGADGMTYANECLLKCSGQSMASDGPCEPPCVCPADDNPVCGSDGVTYSNDCLLNCATKHDSTLSVANTGPCNHSVDVVEQPKCACPELYKPVCGANTITYDNKCFLKCAGQRLLKEGPCEPPCTCPADVRPVCGSDGVTYDNDCLLNCATKYNSRLGISHWGSCSSGVTVVEQPSCDCTRNLIPVCGADGVTYSNMCLLQCAGVELARYGSCDSPPCVCPALERPVCGSDGTTYSNDCILNCATQQNANLYVAHPGPCQDQNVAKPVPCGLGVKVVSP